jgi:hypothetical protein
MNIAVEPSETYQSLIRPRPLGRGCRRRGSRRRCTVRHPTPSVAGRPGRIMLALLTGVRQQEQSSRQSFGEIWFVAEHPHHYGLIHSGKRAVRQGPGGRNSPEPSGQTTLADEISGFAERNDRFLALCRDDRDFDLAFLDVEDGICGVTSACPMVTLERYWAGTRGVGRSPRSTWSSSCHAGGEV